MFKKVDFQNRPIIKELILRNISSTPTKNG